VRTTSRPSIATCIRGTSSTIEVTDPDHIVGRGRRLCSAQHGAHSSDDLRALNGLVT